MSSRKMRAGSTYSNASGKVVHRADHLWTPPNSGDKNGESDPNPLRRTETQKRESKHIDKLHHWLAKIKANRELLDITGGVLDTAGEQKIFHVKERFYEVAKKDYEKHSRGDLLLRLPFTGFFKRRGVLAEMARYPFYLSKGNLRELREIRSVPTEILVEALKDHENELLGLLHRLRNSAGEGGQLSDEQWIEKSDLTKKISTMKDALAYRAVHGDETAEEYMQEFRERIWEAMLGEYVEHGETIIAGGTLVDFGEVARVGGVDEETLATYVWAGLIEPHPKLDLREFEENGKTVVRQVDLDEEPVTTRTFKASDVIKFLGDTGIKLHRTDDGYAPAG